ncbi:MAG TPA: N-acetyl sugar amidotransferase [Candidatus Omnitrophota bacterium]|nr:N-acetyl sugar amidotransferase [Candidatus Omnitrophota bacterium]HPD84104.1 N-acetyl sugar amidotransferase [Candidatus Omnitrophota bacterium]HRZ02961.1 N-acetyl sugar amidotransferase [Candidatus Omnitrophota bacterium]
MNYCTQCLQPDTRPNIKFNAQGVCPACEYWSTLNVMDWDEKRKILLEICDFGIAHKSWGYDCIIGVSGGKDSTRQALFVRNVLKMNPLLVCCTYPPDQVSDRGAYNIQNLISRGFNTVIVGPAPQTWKKNMLNGFYKYGNWQRSTELALFTSVPRLAIAYQIPLIFWGENPALILGELGVRSNGYDGNQMKWANTLAGGDPSWLCVDGITKKDVLCYSYPADEEMTRAGLRIIYLSYFWKVWSRLENGMLAAVHGLDVRDDHSETIGDILGVEALDEDWITVNQMIKFRKFGFARVTELVCEEIRFGRMKREEGIPLIEKYDGKCSDKLVGNFCDYLGISIEEFWRVADSYTNKEIFEKDKKGSWKLKYPVGVCHAR